MERGVEDSLALETGGIEARHEDASLSELSPC